MCEVCAYTYVRMGDNFSHPILSTQRSCVRILSTAHKSLIYGRGTLLYAQNSVAILSSYGRSTHIVRDGRTMYARIMGVRTTYRHDGREKNTPYGVFSGALCGCVSKKYPLWGYFAGRCFEKIPPMGYFWAQYFLIPSKKYPLCGQIEQIIFRLSDKFSPNGLNLSWWLLIKWNYKFHFMMCYQQKYNNLWPKRP